MNATIDDLPEIRFLTSGDVSDGQREATERAVRAALSNAQANVKSVRATLSVIADPSLPRPALAQAVVELDGRRLRAQAAAPDLTEAIDLLQDRLALRAAHLRAS
jgi:ribosome-associated translation inhibitor RaiA